MNKGLVVTFGNQKGGTGKTTSSTMIAYELSNMGYKVLLCDNDPQANATTLYLRTKANSSEDVVNFNKTLMTAISDGDLQPIVTNIKKNLYLLPSFSDFMYYPNFLEKKFKTENERMRYFSELLIPLKQDYDFIFIDVPPTISVITNSALFASDYVCIVSQTHERSLNGAEVFTNHLRELVMEKGANLDTVGILPVLLKNNSNIDKVILKNTIEMFGEEHVFKNVIKHMERIKRFDMTGIKNDDMHDASVHKVFTAVAKEFLERIEREESLKRQALIEG